MSDTLLSVYGICSGVYGSHVHNLRHMYRQQNKPSLYQTKAVCPKVLGKSAVLQSMSAAWDTSFFDYIIAHMFGN